MLRFSAFAPLAPLAPLPALAATCLVANLDASSIAAQLPGVSLSPFVTFLPTGSANPMAGLALAIAGGPLALRGSGHLSVQEHNAAAPAGVTSRPWGADADAVASLEAYAYSDRVALVPYVFTGVGVTALDTAAQRITRPGWSYGAGLSVPVAGALALFGETRWRLSKFVMPDAADAPPALREFRFGLNFRVGGGGSASEVIRLLGDGTATTGGNDNETIPGADMLLSTAERYVGTPYRRGGSSPSGFDASGFVRFVFARLGVTLPRSPRDQARIGQPVRADLRALQPGDLLMFQDGDGITHVAIYVGHAQIIHSSETGGGVRYDDLSSDRGRWFQAHLCAARRVRPDPRGSRIDLAQGYSNDAYGDEPDHAPRASLRRRQ